MRVFVIYYNNEKSHHPHRMTPRTGDFTVFSRGLFSYSGHFQGKISQKSKQGDFLQSFIFCFPFLFSNMNIYLPGDSTVIMTEAARDLFKRDTLFG